ncbi:MAG: AI-2E family transporter [Proteobacteria bacterium]|nr:MAG: AI-2E family transporter [Pseudomonadota bacterium]
MIINRGKLSVTQQRLLVGGIALFLVSLYFLRVIYIPIFIAYFLAFLLNPIVRWFERRGFGRVGPIFLLLILFFAVLASFALFMVPKILVQVRELFQRLPLLMDFLSDRIGPHSLKYFGYDVFAQWKDVLPTLAPENTAYPAVGLLESVLAGTARALSAVLTVMMIPILTFYILKDYYVLNEKLLLLVPRRFLADVKEVMRRLSIVLGGLIRGQFLVCAILAAFYSVALSAVGVDMALLLGILSGLMNLVPFVGPLASLALTLFLAVLNGAQITQSIAIVGVYLVANLVDNTLLTPKIVGRTMVISPLTIILAFLAGGELLGFLGILLALPIIAMVKVLAGFLAERYFASSYYNEEAPLEGRQSLSDQL